MRVWIWPLFLFLPALGCAPLVESAPFTALPDTLRAGDLLGPFDGVVTDQETDRPIGGAVVEGIWAFERGRGLRGPLLTVEKSMETGEDGRYSLPRCETFPSEQGSRLVRFTLTVYRRGYVAYRSDFKFPSGERRYDVSQRRNKVRLALWTSDLSQHRHRLFLGGGEAIRHASSGLGQLASLDLEGKKVLLPSENGKRAGLLSGTLLDVSPLLSEAEVRGVTGYAGPFQVGRLVDRVRTESYDSRHFKSEGEGEAFDVAFRLWKTTPTDALAQFEKLLATLPAAKEMTEIGDRSLRAEGGDVRGLAFILREKGLVVQISCGFSQCTEPSMVLQLAKLIEGHLSVWNATPEVERKSP